MTGVLLFAHGSPVEDANRGVHELAARIEAAGPFRYVRAAFLDDGQPDLLEGVTQAAAAGLDLLIIIPYFLTVGLHLRRDLPKLLAAAKEQHPTLDILVGQSLEAHPLMPSLILGRAQEALEGRGNSR
jgi:sirohydrochlorin ferrochelatase